LFIVHIFLFHSIFNSFFAGKKPSVKALAKMNLKNAPPMTVSEFGIVESYHKKDKVFVD